jgi:hypothetical protein
MTRHDDARSLLRAIYSTEVDIVPDPQANTLTIRLHPLAAAANCAGLVGVAFAVSFAINTVSLE